MIDPPQDYAVFLLILGAVVIASLVAYKKLASLRISPMAAYILIGVGFFFFVAIGPAIDVAAVKEAMDLGLFLLVTAALGKFLSAALPTALMTSPRGGGLIGLSMIPRAEIFLIVTLYRLSPGDWAAHRNLYTTAVIVSLCIFAPIFVQTLPSVTNGIREGS